MRCLPWNAKGQRKRNNHGRLEVHMPSCRFESFCLGENCNCQKHARMGCKYYPLWSLVYMLTQTPADERTCTVGGESEGMQGSRSPHGPWLLAWLDSRYMTNISVTNPFFPQKALPALECQGQTEKQSCISCQNVNAKMISKSSTSIGRAYYLILYERHMQTMGY